MHNDIITRFIEYINSFHIVGEGKIAVAVSGGADSLALTFLTAQWLNKSFVALTVNHNLREEAATEAAQVHKLLTSHKIEHHILNWEHKEKISSNIQHKARLARRELLTNWCNAHNIKTLLVAHTKNDIVETFFMNIFRGSGIYGLSSIKPETIANNVRIIRPVSIFTKQELKNYLQEQRIDWIEDPSNQNKKFLRTKIRNLFDSEEMRSIFPDENLFLNRIITNVKNITRAKDCIESITAEKYSEMVMLVSSPSNLSLFAARGNPRSRARRKLDCRAQRTMTELEGCYKSAIQINREKFCKTHKEIALNILSSCLIEMSKEHEYKPRLASLELLYDFILSKGTGAKTLWKCKIKIAKDTIHITKEIGKVKKSDNSGKSTRL